MPNKKKHKKLTPKQRQKLLRSRKHICADCGFMGRVRKTKKGSWLIFFIKLAFILPVIAIIILLSMVEGLLRALVLSKPTSLIWHIGFQHYFPYFPHVIIGCPKCSHGNSMKMLKTREGCYIYERFERDHFLFAKH